MPRDDQVHVILLGLFLVVFAKVHPDYGIDAALDQVSEYLLCALGAACHIHKDPSGLALVRAKDDLGACALHLGLLVLRLFKEHI